MVKISERLKTAASLIDEGAVLCDVGTDHGYVPIYLLQKNIIKSAIAMDINKGPLEKANENLRLYELRDKVDTRLSDGLNALKPGEADEILIAGMGGNLVIHILTEGEKLCKSMKKLVLQPQSEIDKVRHFLVDNGYITYEEKMLREDGKFYFMMSIHYGDGEKDDFGDELNFKYGKFLLKQKESAMTEYLLWEHELLEDLLVGIKAKELTDRSRARLAELERELELNRQAMRLMAD